MPDIMGLGGTLPTGRRCASRNLIALDRNLAKAGTISCIRAGYPRLYLVSHEEQRVAPEMTRSPRGT